MITLIIQIFISLSLLMLITIVPLIIFMYVGHSIVRYFFKDKLIENRKLNRNYFYNIQKWFYVFTLAIIFIMFGQFFKSIVTFSLIGYLLVNVCVFGYFINYFLSNYIKKQTLTHLIYQKNLLIGRPARLYCLSMIFATLIYTFFIFKYVGFTFFVTLVKSSAWPHTGFSFILLTLSLIILPILILYNNVKKTKRSMLYTYSKKKYKFKS